MTRMWGSRRRISVTIGYSSRNSGRNRILSGAEKYPKATAVSDPLSESDHLSAEGSGSAELSASADSLRPRPTPALIARPHRAENLSTRPYRAENLRNRPHREENLRAAINPNTQTNATPMAKIVVAFANPTVAARNPAPMAGTDMNT